ncbi:MAG: SRPBCC domain-containing protein [Saprospiraceae bacterium]|nr:SRPBCC domain-containing protein [Saprospiraceae bacterium]
MTNKNDMSSRTLTLQKVIDAPVELVWEAWTNAEHVMQWWAPPGMKINMISHDFNVGGKWKYSMPMPNGIEFISEGTYLEIEKFKKIVSSADFKPMTEGVELHVSFEADGDKTIFTFSVVHETEDYCKAQEKMGFYNGWGSTFNRMETMITTQLKKI